MNLQNIEYFLQLAKRQHMSSTADLLHISQSSLSKHISALEAEVGTKLFDRVGNRIVLNKSGEQFAQYAQQAMFLLRAGTQSAKSGMYDIRGTVHIAYMLYAPIVAKSMAHYSLLNPLIDFRVIALDGVKMAHSEEVDLIFTAGPTDQSQGQENAFWVSRTLFQERFGMLYSPHTVQRLDKVPTRLADLKSEFFVTMAQHDTKDGMFSDVTFPLCMQAGFFPKVYCKTDEFLVKVKLVQSGMVVALIPEACWEDVHALAPELAFVPLEEEGAKRTISAMRHKKSLMTEAALDFWDFLMDFYHLEPDTEE